MNASSFPFTRFAARSWEKGYAYGFKLRRRDVMLSLGNGWSRDRVRANASLTESGGTPPSIVHEIRGNQARKSKFWPNPVDDLPV
jgi:hypothetical protein